MRAYKLEIEINLDDEGYILENNWILNAIQEQLEGDEQIVRYRINPILENEATTWRYLMEFIRVLSYYLMGAKNE